MACVYRNEYGTDEGTLMFSEASYRCLLFGCLICNNMNDSMFAYVTVFLIYLM